MDANDRAQAHREWSQLVIHIYTTKPFFGRLVTNLRPEFFDTLPNDSLMQTNGTILRINWGWWRRASLPQRRTVAMHEIVHCAALHPWRRGGRDLETWNRACDHAVNLELSEQGEHAIDGWLCDMRFAGMSAEEIYVTLHAEQQQQQQRQRQQGDDDAQDDAQGQGGDADGAGDGSSGPGQTFGGMGDFEDPEPDEGESHEQARERTEQQWREAVIMAANSARGDQSGFAESLVRAARAGNVPYTELMREWLSERVRSDYSWRRPNTRHMSRGILLSSLCNEALGTVVVVRDTSASMSDELISNATGEIEAILEDVRPAKVIVFDIDTEIHARYDIERDESLPAEIARARGRGGTRFEPVFEWLADEGQDEDIAGVVYMTDMEATFPQDDPGVPVLWIATRNEGDIVPFGEVVPMFPRTV